MSPDKVELFRQFTGADAETARSFLNQCEDNLEMAVGLYMDDPTSIQTNANVAPVSDECRSPIPQRTERLIPMDLPIYPSHLDRGSTLRSRRRAFVTDDSDDEIQLLSDSVSESSDILSRLGGTQNGASSSVHASSELNNGDLSRHGSRTNGSRVIQPRKRGYLQQLYEPPTELLFDGTLLSARAAAREKNHWLLVSLHDEGCFDCHLLNRDVWKDPKVYQLVKRNFIFLQIPIDSPEGIRFRSLHSYVQSASHISILNPYTGEQQMMWMHLKDAATVHEALTEFLQHTKLQPPTLATDVATDPKPCHSRHSVVANSTTSTLPGSRRPHSDIPDDGLSSSKRPRLGARESEATATLSSRVAAVSSQLTHSNPLNLSEEEQLRLAIEASTVEAIQHSRPTRSFTRSAKSKDDEDLIVLTDDEEDVNDGQSSEDGNEDLDASPGLRSDGFIFDPDAHPTTTSTATISCRRPLRPTTATASVSTKMTESHSVVSTGKTAISGGTEPTPTGSTSHKATQPQLPVPGADDDVLELAVRLPDGHREVFRLASTVTLQILQRYFTLRGFSQAHYELVRLYPYHSLSKLSGQTTLAEMGLAKKDTLFLQER